MDNRKHALYFLKNYKVNKLIKIQILRNLDLSDWLQKLTLNKHKIAMSRHQFIYILQGEFTIQEEPAQMFEPH